MLHRLVEGLDQRAEEAADLLGRQLARDAVVAQPGLPQDLVAVDGADAGDHLLVHQQGLELQVPAQQRAGERGPGDGVGDGVEPAGGELRDLVGHRVGGDDERLARAARVDEADLAALGEAEVTTVPLGGVDRGGDLLEVALLAEVDEEQLAVVEVADEERAAAVDAT